MGDIQHHAIIVTSDFKNVEEAREKAMEIFAGCCEVSPVSKPAINGFKSFCVFPDGSKEGWADSNEANDRRASFTLWLKEHCYEWVLVTYGEYGVGVQDAFTDELAPGRLEEKKR